jgi:predicted NBD/HSP70 family sugar kinase
MGDFNQTVILDAIRRSEAGISRTALAQVTGLSGQAITNITRRLIDAGLVSEGERTVNGRGKPRTTLNLEPSGQYAIGVHLDPVVLTYVALDLTGRTIGRAQQWTPTVRDPQGVVAGMAEEIAVLVRETGIDRARVVGVGIAAPGPIDIERGIVIDPPNLAGWGQVPLREALGEATGLPVLLDKDVTAAASAERWAGGAQGGGSFVFFYLGTGVGAGLVIGGQVMRGSSQNVGEIGHITVDPDGPLCFCGRRGCLGESSQPRYLVQRGILAGLLPADIDLADPTRVEEAFGVLCELAAAGGEARAILLELVDRIAKAVEDIANLLDLDRVIFGGPHWSRLRPFFGERLKATLRSRFLARSIHQFEVVGTSLGEDVGAVGAASLVLDHTFSTNPSVLLLNA